TTDFDGVDLTVLDIGCGTGMSSELLLSTELGSRIGRVDLLDTSPKMLEKAVKRSSGWGIRVNPLPGTIEDLPKSTQYDIILACSVLHHTPALDRFLSQLVLLQADGGVFLHLQDPNGDYLMDEELSRRVKELARYQRPFFPGWA